MGSSEGVFGGGGAFLDAAARDALVAEQTPFQITDVDPERDSQFGAQAVYTIRLGSIDKRGQFVADDDDDVFLAFSHGDNDSRLRDAQKHLKALSLGDGTLEPVYLHEVTTGSGRTARVLRSVPMESAPKAKPATAAKGRKPAAAEADDDIPF